MRLGLLTTEAQRALRSTEFICESAPTCNFTGFGRYRAININGNIKELYEFIDLEKFDYFEKVFIDFCKFYDGEDNTVFNNNNNNFNFQTLLKAITTVNENNISSNDMKIIDSTFL